ncbi:MAG: hypothetical protein EOP38_11395 [Rubrivivax sp.]|nr:MAG: hypothetical protein EOP38_11395 [Rubrivivax sp.]
MTHTARPFSTASALTSLAVATLMMPSAQALAATPSNSELQGVKLYGDVSIAQDSVNNWGPWEQFEPPAAAPAAVTLPRVTAELYRTLPRAVTPGTPTPPVVIPPETPSLIGFGAFSTLSFNQGEGGSEQSVDGPHSLSLTGTAVTPSSTGATFPDAIRLQTTTLSGSPYSRPDSGALTLQDGAYSRDQNGQTQTSLTLVPPEGVVGTEEAKVSFYSKSIINYVRDAQDPDQLNAQSFVMETGVIGVQTSVTDMADLQRTNATASYQGKSMGGSDVIMNVNFAGQGSWTGSWNNGADSAQGVGFNASGTISGAQFNSTSVSTTDDANISGFVKGAFYGSRAAAAGGVADITKNEVRTVDAFVATQAQAALNTAQASKVAAGAK